MSFQRFWGHMSLKKDGTSLPIYVDGQAFNKRNTVKVWRLVEKKTDVNIAMAMYRDACKGLVDQLILVSNDSDAEPVLLAITEDFPQLKLGLIMPLAFPEEGKRSRPPSSGLARLSHWARTYIRDKELKNAQLPELVSTRKKPAKKPAHWS